MSAIYTELCGHVNAAIHSLKSQGFLPEDVDASNVVVEQPKDVTHGDFATNAAMVLAKPARKNPREIAEKLVDAVKTSATGLVEDASIAGPGFVNFKVNQSRMQAQLLDILKAGETYGESTVGNGISVNLEFVSANPTGPMHFGHGRNAVVGDALGRLLKKAGYDVFREYLMNDAGGQMRVVVQSVHTRYLQSYGQNIELPEGCYPGESVKDIASKLKEQDGDKWLEVTDQEVLFKELRGFCAAACMDMIKSDLKALDVPFDNFFSEYAMHQTGAVKDAEAKLRKNGFVYEGTLPPPKGKAPEDWKPVELTLFKATDFGEEVDQAIYKPNGDVTYLGQDIAYHNIKLERGANQMINVWGADHAGAVKRLEGAIEALTGKKKVLKTILIQMVRLMRDGELVKMSKRAGTFVTLKEVLDEVGGDAVRFWMLTRKADAQFDFDLTKAVEKSNDNPVFYVQYAHARMCSVYRQQVELGIASAKPEDVDLSLLNAEQEVEMMRVLGMFPQVVERAAIAQEPHRIAFYAMDLATKFHSWYNAEKFLLPEDVALTHARLLLVKATQQVLQNTLAILGVTAPEKM